MRGEDGARQLWIAGVAVEMEGQRECWAGNTHRETGKGRGVCHDNQVWKGTCIPWAWISPSIEGVAYHGMSHCIVPRSRLRVWKVIRIGAKHARAVSGRRGLGGGARGHASSRKEVNAHVRDL